jgi:DNA-binding MarR family transcriptional regulator
VSDADAAAPDELTYLLDSVFRVERAVTRIGNQRLTPWNLTLSGYAAMRIIENRPHLSLAQLARRAFVRSQTMTRIVSNLCERGFIERSPHPESERAMSLTLTPLGVTTLREMDKEVLKINRSFASALAPGEKEELTRMLRACALTIEAELRELK